MKRILTYIVIATLAMGFIGCKPDNPVNTENPEETIKPEGGNEDDKTEPGDEDTPSEEVVPETLRDKICGEWHYTSEDKRTDIRLALDTDGTHELYQKFDGGVHHLYRGTWTLTDDILYGQYNDQIPWSTSYQVDISEDKNTLTLTSTAGEEDIIFIYSREDIPDSIRDTCIPAVRSSNPSAY